MNDYAIRLSIPYTDASGVVTAWAERCETMVVYEHEADEEVNTTHLHLIIFKSSVKDEALKRIFRKILPVMRQGNELWSFKTTYESNNVLNPVDEGAITYASKGKLEPKFLKNISPAKVEELRGQWVDRRNGFDKSGSSDKRSATDYYIDKMLDQYKDFSYDQLRSKHINAIAVRDEDDNIVAYSTSEEDVLTQFLKWVRTDTMHMMFRETRHSPPATLYKSVAGTVYLRVCEKMGKLNPGMEVLKDLWY